jgi:hypothetical protein
MTNPIAEEYRVNIRQCLAWAEQASDPENRAAFYELAKTWDAAARRLEQSAASYRPRPQAMAMTVDLA